MNERQFGYRVKQTLNQGLALDESTLSRLRTAREAALEKQRIRASNPLLAWAGNVPDSVDSPRRFIPAVLAAAFLLAIGLFAVNYWHQSQRVQETAEIDAAVLTGELPIDAYLDKGFNAWLKNLSD